MKNGNSKTGFTFTPIDFIEAWQKSDSIAKVCENLGIAVSRKNRIRMGGRASVYRKRGVPLKKFPRTELSGRAPYDWAYLSFHAQKVLDEQDGGEEI